MKYFNVIMVGKRYNYIDRLKGFAIFMVVFGHVVVYGLRNYDDPLRVFASSFHMPLFFFLSGFVVLTTPSPAKFLVKVCKYLCPFLMVGLIYNYFISRSLLDFFLDKAKAGYWYLWVLTEFYFVLMLLYKHNNKTRKGIIIDIVLLFSVLIVFIFADYKFPQVSNIFTLGSCKNYWPFFFGGVLFRKYNLILFMKNHARLIYTVSIVLYISAFSMMITLLLSSHLNAITGMAAIAFLVLFFEERETNYSFWNNELQRLGKNSLEIYIFEYFLLTCINLQTLEEWFVKTHNILLEVFLILVLTIIISYSSLFIGKLSHKTGYLDDVIYGKFASRI